MIPSLPVDAEGLTPAWLSQALAARYPGVRVAAAEVLDTSAATNFHVRIGLDYDVRAGGPDTIFCKLPPLDPAHREAIGATGMGAREAWFYADLSSSIAMRMPTAHFAQADADGSFVLLLEDLQASGCKISDGSWGIPATLAAGALEDLAALHVAFEVTGRVEAVGRWAATRQPGATEFTVGTLRHVVDHHSDALTDAYVTVAEMYIADHEAIDALWTEGPQTLLHGDAHIGNLFIDDDRVGFLDWGLLTVSTPMRDVSYFLTMGMNPDDRRGSERELMQHYLDVRRSLGGVDISFDDAWMAHRLHTAYTVLASFLSMVPPYNAPEQDMFNAAFRERSFAALDDLDTVGALRHLLG